MSNRGSANMNITVESPEESDTKAQVRINLERLSKCASPEIEPDDIDVTDTVTFTWEIQ